MRGSRNFRQGGPSSDNVFSSSFFLVLSLFYRSQMVNLNEIYHFSRCQRGSNIFQGGGGSNFFQGGSNCLFPIETHITCDFPGGSGPPVPPGSALALLVYPLRSRGNPLRSRGYTNKYPQDPLLRRGYTSKEKISTSSSCVPT